MSGYQCGPGRSRLADLEVADGNLVTVRKGAYKTSLEAWACECHDCSARKIRLRSWKICEAFCQAIISGDSDALPVYQSTASFFEVALKSCLLINIVEVNRI
jgi:hypothetical protein